MSRPNSNARINADSRTDEAGRLPRDPADIRRHEDDYEARNGFYEPFDHDDYDWQDEDSLIVEAANRRRDNEDMMRQYGGWEEERDDGGETSAAGRSVDDVMEDQEEEGRAWNVEGADFQHLAHPSGELQSTDEELRMEESLWMFIAEYVVKKRKFAAVNVEFMAAYQRSTGNFHLLSPEELLSHYEVTMPEHLYEFPLPLETISSLFLGLQIPINAHEKKMLEIRYLVNWPVRNGTLQELPWTGHCCSGRSGIEQPRIAAEQESRIYNSGSQGRRRNRSESPDPGPSRPTTKKAREDGYDGPSNPS